MYALCGCWEVFGEGGLLREFLSIYLVLELGEDMAASAGSVFGDVVVGL